VRGVAVLCHPHPLHGGTMDNKVIQTLARAFVQLGYRPVRFNFRGVGGSQGQFDHGVGEVDDALSVIAACRDAAVPLALGGFSFGGYVAAQAAERLAAANAPAQRLVLIGPATSTFPVPAVPADSMVIPAKMTTWAYRCQRPRLGAAARSQSSLLPAWATASMVGAPA
jgi:alpha/beta superfamily hydrolase